MVLTGCARSTWWPVSVVAGVVLLLSACSAGAQGEATGLAQDERLTDLEEEVAPRGTAEQLETLRDCMTGLLGAPLAPDGGDDRQHRASIVCTFELGLEEVYWYDVDEVMLDAMRQVTLD